MIFSDAHSGASVCTPTRYGLMTGRYSWRTWLQELVVKGYDDNLITEERDNVAKLLSRQGYHTAIIGKWHLNFNYIDPKTNKTLPFSKRKQLPPVGARIPDGPVARGFDYYHGIHHAGSMKSIIENDRVILQEDEVNFLPRCQKHAVDYINQRAKDDKPFFLYLPLGSPHAPIVPTKEWVGKSGISRHADFVMQTDDTICQIQDVLEKNGLSENTVIIYSSDNGTSRGANIPEMQAKGHYPSGQFRGSKADLWDGGHRIPFIIKWPGVTEAGTCTNQTICLTDFFATLADYFDEDIPAGVAEDSVSFFPALKGEAVEQEARVGIVHHSISGHFGYRKGKWKLLLARGSGGWSSPNELKSKKEIEGQLYDMENDPRETTNLYQQKPEIVAELLSQLEKDVYSGRSTLGGESKNDPEAKIVLWKSGRD